VLGAPNFSCKIKEVMANLNVEMVFESHGFDIHGNAGTAVCILVGRLFIPRRLAVSHPPCAIGEPSQERDPISRCKTPLKSSGNLSKRLGAVDVHRV
jgi:hypothetical protein